MLIEDEAGAGDGALPILGVTPKTLAAVLGGLPAAAAAYATACRYKGEAGEVFLAPRETGALAAVLLGTGEGRAHEPFASGRLAPQLPPGDYRLAGGFDDLALATLAFELGAYKFTRFRKDNDQKATDKRAARLRVPAGVDGRHIAMIADAIAMGRDLINRPTNDLGPEALEAAARELAEAHGADVGAIRGDDLIAQNFPMIHAVGRAAAEAPRLVDVTWGDPAAPKVTLVGKGVCFDTGGLDIKPSSGMILMKKDMGGAATALSLAAMIMGAKLPVRLRVLLPIVENSISGNAFRPGDVLASRKGLSVEIGNTDAEGRLILADALALADEEAPELLLDFATLTGAARVALGPDLPPYYTASDTFAADIEAHARKTNDPGWRMPLWEPYDKLLKSKIADVNNISGGSFAGSMTAALFLRRFVERATVWAHFDVYGWTPSARPGRPEGGEVLMAHCLFGLLAARYGRAAA